MAFRKKSIKLFFLILLTVVPIAVFAQQFDEFDTQSEEKEPGVEKKQIKPDFQTWKISGYGAFQDSTTLDTLIDFFQVYNPVFKNVITATYLGNYGSPALNNDFFNRKNNIDFFFLQSRSFYLLSPVDIVYYNTRTPYTRLDFSQSENRSVKNETRFNVFHSQNVNPYLNFVFRMDMGKSAGQYNSQEGKNNFITLYSNYNKDNLSIYGGFISNLIANNENGGLMFDSLISTDTETELLKVNLTESKSRFNNVYFFADGEYKFGKVIEIDSVNSVFRPVFGFLYNFNYQRNKQEFSENESADNVFFRNTFYGSDYSKDSVRFNKLDNIFQIKQYENANRKTSFGKRAFLGMEAVKYNMPGLQEGATERISRTYSNVYVGGGIFRQTGKFWTWNFSGKMYLLGRNIGQTELKGVISKPFTFWGDSLAVLKIHGNISNRVADPFQEEFYSNHFKWKIDMKMEQRMEAGGTISMPGKRLLLGANYALINNFIYNGYDTIPAQTGKELLVVSVFADKDFKLGNFHFRPRVLWQKASNEEVIHLPAFSTFVSTYFKWVMAKVMYAQIGVDLRYNTLYYADGYSPATGLFYLQNEKKYGNYPYLDAYASLRLKRTTVFFKMMNAGTRFVSGEYITAPHYPMPRSTFRLGISWAFYD
ncbi:MAG: hypothetical protein CSA36_02610 [Draconibacterium sp.]|nr:MAG: hypothetical protein CSA36_02610 [Draconibacterium sp.]